MGKADTITKKYMENPTIFADAFNQFLYHGDQKIDSAQLTELDKGDVNMCLAIQQMREESELAGQIKGTIEAYKDLDVSLADTIKRIAEKFHLSESESLETVKKYW